MKLQLLHQKPQQPQIYQQVRISEIMSCKELADFFTNLAYIAHIRQNQNLHRDIIILTDVTGTLYIVSIRLA